MSKAKLVLQGSPNERQKLFFASRARYTAYGGARGGGKSWALRRKLTLMCLRYPGIKCLLVRRTLPELRENHINLLKRELASLTKWSECEKCLTFRNGSRILFGYCQRDSDTDRYQGQEFDIIALDEATQLSESAFNAFKACLRGSNDFPKRIYLTCNPGGVGHAWVKRLFVDRRFEDGEEPSDYLFIQAKASDNPSLALNCPGYIDQLRSLPENLRRAWLDGSWDCFSGQFFSEFSRTDHVCDVFPIPREWKRFCALDYGFDMLAVLWFAVDYDGRCYIYREFTRPNLTLSEAAKETAERCAEDKIEYICASPDLWNRRQDTGYSGFEIMSRTEGLPALIRADNRRKAGWRAVREYLGCGSDKAPMLRIFSSCDELITCMGALIFDRDDPEDASSEPHAVTHLPEALRYGIMSRISAPEERAESDFIIPSRKNPGIADY